MGSLRVTVLAAVLAFASTSSCEVASETTPVPASVVSTAAPTPTFTEPRASAPVPSVRTGSSIAFVAGKVVVADEPTQALYLPESGTKIPMPGRPAQLVANGDRLYVTVRDAREGGLLVELRPIDGTLVEVSRAVLAYDAWGIALSSDGATAVVTSAWSHRVAGVDLGAMKTKWSLDVGREPRGVVLRDDGTAWVSHLVTAALDRIDGATSDAPVVKRVDLPPAPLRSKDDAEGSLGWSLALSDDGARLFAPRHALGAFGRDAWFGVATVDVMLTKNDAPLVPRTRQVVLHKTWNAREDDRLGGGRGTIAIGELAPFTQPRAVLYQKGTESLFVLGEGDARVAVLDAEALDPSLVVRHRIELGDGCSGPTGMAFGRDELVVHCAASFTWVRVPLAPEIGKPALRTYASDPLPEAAAAGRRFFVDAKNGLISGGLGCAGCHPEGRDDGHVWHEIDTSRSGIETPFDVVKTVFVSGVHVAETDGLARQTPMLAGRVASPGPYGWKAQAATLEARVKEGTELHRWRQGPFDDDESARIVKSLALYLRTGLVAPVDGRPMTDEEKLGKTIFERSDVGCAGCHGDGGDGATHYFSRWHTRAGFEGELTGFRTPNLRFVSHTAPYFHDGSARTLADLIDDNDDRMGKTTQLDERERLALIAYLRTL